MSEIEYSSELANALERLSLDWAAEADWDDVLARLHQRSGAISKRARWRRPPLVALAAVMLVLVLAAIATATYLVLRSASAGAQGGLAIEYGGSGSLRSYERVVIVEPGGRLRTIWHCPNKRFCGQLVSLDFSPDGRRLAISLDELGGTSPYVGLHIIDTSTGADRRLPKLAANGSLRQVVKANGQALGCFTPYQLDWSPDGKWLAYVCPNGSLTPPGRIFLIKADGSQRIPLRSSSGVHASSPSWSPDGRRIAFAVTGLGPPAVYTVNRDGSDRRLVATHASLPAWSPNGDTIAYNSTLNTCRGIRLVTPTGEDRTPVAQAVKCNTIGPPGTPVWSPDGRQIAIGTRPVHGVYVVNTNGTSLRRVTTAPAAGPYGAARPTWSPETATTGIRIPQQTRTCQAC